MKWGRGGASGVDGLEKRAREAGELLTRLRLSAQTQVRELSAATVCSRADLVQADTDLAAAQQAAAQAEAVERKAEGNLSSKQQALLAAEAVRNRTKRSVFSSRMRSGGSFRPWRSGRGNSARKLLRRSQDGPSFRTSTQGCRNGLNVFV